MADTNGDRIRAEAQRAADHAKAAGGAATDSLRDTAYSTAEQVRQRARHAGDWARSRFDELQSRVEDRPRSAALWALGIGVVAGILFSSLLLRGRD
jgi:ElaB/YqjD/DUF883 family membrane-anchored ribosome-binding protein